MIWPVFLPAVGKQKLALLHEVNHRELIKIAAAYVCVTNVNINYSPLLPLSVRACARAREQWRKFTPRVKILPSVRRHKTNYVTWCAVMLQ